MNRQAIFNRVCAHLFVQGRPAVGGFGECYYQHPNDPSLRCAIGGILPTRLRNMAKDDSGNINEVMCSCPEIRTYFQVSSEEDGDFLRDLQLIHDMRSVPYWKRILRNFARRHELSLPAIFRNV